MDEDMRSPNISVTPINVEPLSNGDIVQVHTHLREPQRTHSAPHPAANGDVLDSSDAEVAQIDFQSAVNLRNKKKRADVQDVPRPMSWEGELSDGERDMCIDDDNGSQVGIVM